MTVKSVGEIGSLVRDRRKRLGITQGDLAERAGVSRKWVSELEGGKETVQFDAVLAVFGVLAIDVGDLNGSAEVAGSAASAGSRSDNADINARIRERGQAASFGTDLLDSGVAAVGLDDEGRIVRYEPDGTTTLVG